MRSALAGETRRRRRRRADNMRTSVRVPSPSSLIWVIYTSLLIGNISALVNESKDVVDRVESTTPIRTETIRPSSTEPTHTSPLSTKGMVNETYDTTIACGNKTAQCPLYCQVCIGHPLSDCYEMMHDYICYNTFTNSMDQFNNTDFCLWHVVQRPYNAFSECSEEIADCLLIPWPNPHVEKIFVDIHAKYFQDCTVEELRDPPPSVVFALVMTPICLIPAMVFLVVLKTKNGDGRS